MHSNEYSTSYVFMTRPQSKEWKCHLFGSDYLIYYPSEDGVPNAFVRFMMRICLGCKWVRIKQERKQNG